MKFGSERRAKLRRGSKQKSQCRSHPNLGTEAGEAVDDSDVPLLAGESVTRVAMQFSWPWGNALFYVPFQLICHFPQMCNRMMAIKMPLRAPRRCDRN